MAASATLPVTLQGTAEKRVQDILVNWLTQVRNATTGDTVNTYTTDTDVSQAIRASLVQGRTQYDGRCIRTFLFFDVSSITDIGTITSATVKILGFSGNQTTDTIIVEGTAWNGDGTTTTLSTSDYSNLDFNTAYSSKKLNWSGTGVYNDFSLNATAISDMNTNGYLNCAVIEGDYDYDGQNVGLGVSELAGITFEDPNNVIEIQLGYTINATKWPENLNKVLSAAIQKINGTLSTAIVRVINTPSDSDPFNLNIGTGFNNYLYRTALQSDGKIVIVGGFDTFNGNTRNSIVRLNSNGTDDTAFYTNIGTGFSYLSVTAFVYSTEIQSDGKILVGGNFDTLNGNTRKYLVRLNSNGTEDTAFYTNLGSSFGWYVRRMAIQSDGKIVAVGRYTSFNGNTRRYIVRLNSNGTEDTAFYTNLGTGFNNASLGLLAVAIQTDGKILVGGSFTTLNGTTRNRLVRLNSNGTLDTSFSTNLGTGFNNFVENVTIQSDGKILVGGGFTTLNGTTRNRLVRLNSNGTLDTSFSTNLGTGFNNNIDCITVQTDGKILVGGVFSTVNGSSLYKYLVRLNSTGTVDTAFQANGTPNNFVEDIVEDSGNDLIVGGRFVSIDGIARNYIVKFNSDGSTDN